MNTRKARQYRRVAQACENCRRKKIRCLGQRPKCSACVRLGQQCSYSDSEYASEQIANEVENRVVHRLKHLEQKLNMIIGKTEKPQSTEQASFASVSGGESSILASPPTETLTCPELSIGDISTKALDIYFERFHRQPLWLFEPNTSPTPDSSEELTCVILALGLTYSPGDFPNAGLRSPEFYGLTARRLIMLQIADGSVNLQTLQALCLLAFFNVVSGNLLLAGLNLGVAKNTLQYSTLQYGSSYNSPSPQEQSKLFWSLSFMDTFYGSPALIPSITDDITAPRCLSVEARYCSMPCPPLPRGSYTAALLPDVWAHTVRICSLWGDVRLYVSRCVEGVAEAPWRPNSDYVTLCSRLLDLESGHPNAISYNTVNLPSRSPQDVQDNRADWLPWFRVQVTYHAIHCVLNHPFLYSFKASKQRLSSNTFWRTSSEKALRHCTWISRLLKMASEKGLQLADPFFAQAAAVAGSMQLYWIRADDPDLCSSAKNNLSICTTLLTEMGSHSPVCRSIEHALQEFIDLASPVDKDSGSMAPMIVAKTSLMWLLLDVASPQLSIYSGERSCGKDTCSIGFDSQGFRAENDAELVNHPSDMRENTAHYDSPPEWLSSRSGNPASPTETAMEGGTTQSVEFGSNFNGVDGTTSLDFSWRPWEQIMRMGDGSIGGVNWWEFGDL